MFLCIFVAPMLMAMLALLACVPYLVCAHVARVEAPMSHDMGDAQEWADELSMSLDVDAEWCRLADMGALAPMVWRMPTLAVPHVPAHTVGALAYTPRRGRRRVDLGACPPTLRCQVFT